MKSAKNGDRINILCEVKLEDGTVCYKNEEKNPLEFVLGEGNFLPEIESTLQGMKEGETKTITVEPEDAFGPYIDDLVVEVPKDVFDPEVELEVGSKIKINVPSGKSYYGTVKELTEENLQLDLNHPLAGKKIIITVTLESIEDKEKPSTEKKSRFQLKKPKKQHNVKKRKSNFNPLKTK